MTIPTSRVVSECWVCGQVQYRSAARGQEHLRCKWHCPGCQVSWEAVGVRVTDLLEPVSG